MKEGGSVLPKQKVESEGRGEVRCPCQNVDSPINSMNDTEGAVKDGDRIEVKGQGQCVMVIIIIIICGGALF